MKNMFYYPKQVKTSKKRGITQEFLGVILREEISKKNLKKNSKKEFRRANSIRRSEAKAKKAPARAPLHL